MPPISPPEASGDERQRFVRRSHRKSRAGCANCKRRRIKCDENKPACGNCASRSIECSYLTSRHAAASPRSAGHASTASPEHASRSSQAPPAEGNRDYGSDAYIPYYSDLELMHHYTTLASEELGGGSFWSSELPRRSFKNHALLHMVLALSAIHLAHVDRSRRAECIHEADRHYTIALPRVVSELSGLHEGNAADLYTASVLICLTTFARGPQDGQYIVFSDEGGPEWLPLLRGLKSIREKFAHVLSAGSESESESIRGASSRVPQTRAPAGYREHLAELQTLIQRMHAEEPGVIGKYSTPLRALKDCFVAHFEGPEHAEMEHSQALLSWIYLLSEEYLDALQAKKPLALVIYAYYAVLIKELERQWLYRDWARHVCAGIAKHLHADFRTYVQWPFEQVGYIHDEHSSPST